jgi:hypothetical protein
MPRPWASTTNVYVPPEDHVWVFDRCEDKGCAGSSVAPISGIVRRRLSDENFGAGLIVSGRARILGFSPIGSYPVETAMSGWSLAGR